MAIQPCRDATTCAALQHVLTSDIVIATSPNAVRAAARLMPLRARPDTCWLAVGAGTQRSLRRLGIAAEAPVRMDSEGLLALPALTEVRDRHIGLITAPGGRDHLMPALRARGARVCRADVYRRIALPLADRQRTRLEAVLAHPERIVLLLSSGEALSALLTQIRHPHLHDIAVVAASTRLADIARAAGFSRIVTATDPRPASLLRSATQLAAST
jgi:uroporphyrinogen-III synthase